MSYDTQLYQETINRNSILKIFGKELKPHKTIIEGFESISGNPSNIGFFVVDDSIINTNNKYTQIMLGNYNTNDKETIKYLEKAVINYTKDYLTVKDTKLEIKDAAAGLSAIVTFIALYLGIIFLISSSAIMALKVLSDCIDDRFKYKTLREIGADEKDINKALFKQTLIFFLLPLSLAVVHTIFGLKFCTFILNSIGVNNILEGSIATFGFLIFIYGIYFIITYLYSKNLIKEK